RRYRRFQVDACSTAANRAARRLDTGEGAHELNLTVSLGSRDTHDLALGQGEANRAETISSQVGHLEHDLFVCPMSACGKSQLERTTDHQGDEVLLRHAGRVVGALADAVARHRHALGNAKDLEEPMADVDNPDSSCGPLENEGVQALHFGGA